MSEERGDILKAVATLLSNLSGTVTQPVASATDIHRLQRAWDDYHGVPRTERRLFNVLGLAPYDAKGHASTCDRVKPMALPAYIRRSDGSCAHCGNVLTWPGQP